jgi:hypothetical protein
MYAVSESLSELGDALRLTTTDEAMFGRDDEAMEDSGVTSFTCVNGEEAVGDAGALVAMGDLPDGALARRRRATMSNYDRRSDSSVRC